MSKTLIHSVHKAVFDPPAMVKLELFPKFLGTVCLKNDPNDASLLCNEFNSVLNLLFSDHCPSLPLVIIQMYFEKKLVGWIGWCVEICNASR